MSTTPVHINTLHTSPSALRWTLASLSLSMLLSSVGASIANVGLPTMAQAFNASFQQVQWVILAYLLSITTVIVSVGCLGDMIGRRRLLLTGIALFTLASALCGMAASLPLLIVARGVQGLGAAIMMALTTALVTGTVPAAKTGSAIGLLATMSSVGTALGPTLGGLLLSAFGWTALFLATVPLGVLAWGLAYRFLPADADQDRKRDMRFDYLGTLLLALTLAAYALAVTLTQDGLGMLNLVLLCLACLGLSLFILIETRSPAPLIRLAIFHSPVLSKAFTSSTLVMTVVMATMVVGPFYLSGALRLDAAHLGLVMSVSPLAAALTGVPAGRLVDRFGAHRMALAGLLAMLAGSLLLSMLPMQAGIPGYVAPLALLAAGYALFQTANNTSAMKHVMPDQRGVVSGMLGLSRNLGLITGASLMGAVFAFGSRSADLAGGHAASMAMGMRMTFAAAVVLVLIALAILAPGKDATKQS
ncbi:MFS transporter [Pigmentiphaga aceris]|uniref:MFS transporter n=1 Tax=Pigmentiphaga aceris TaxID=1940612 RepID=A0A5C0B1C6_9BURK|nr:MFS transporter [Pigmentiphaga aceris]QEI06437.1 MFS transporter [Pigmentiphaga aceris]